MTDPSSGAEVDDDERPWLDPVSEGALRAVIPFHMDARSAALYARWWQIETWIRELIYVELRALRGKDWDSIVQDARKRLQRDAAFTHMSGPDNDNPLAYLDYSQLLTIIAEHWDVLGYALLDRESWDGRQHELKQIRHRIGHLRRPHEDDLNRLEQTLRDLERGAFIALASYNDRWQPNSERHKDPVTQGWVLGRHADAQRLLVHADRQYETRLTVHRSRRPWAQTPDDLSSAPGVLWHADFYMRGRTVDVGRLWRDVALARVRPLLLHMTAQSPNHVGFTFSGADDAADIADAIGTCFDAVLMSLTYGRIDIDDYETWQRRARRLDYRVVSGEGWNIVDSSTLPISNFGAGGGVSDMPTW
jgi:hypothetical protein